MKKVHLVLLLFVLSVSSFRPVGSWGFDVHRELTSKAVEQLPEEWRTFFREHEDELRSASVDPDLRRSSDLTEAPRHYDDQDDPHLDRNVSSRSPDYRKGVVAWAVENSTILLIKALESDDLAGIIRYAGDLAHYVGDASQPLHSTENYDGQLTGNRGIHSRYESSFTYEYFDELFDTGDLDGLIVVDDPYELIEGQIISGLEVVPDIMAADNKADAADPSRGSKYYQVMYEELGEMTRNRFKLAVQNIANLWYTALVVSDRYEPPQQTSNISTMTSPDVSPPVTTGVTVTVPMLPVMLVLLINHRRIRSLSLPTSHRPL